MVHIQTFRFTANGKIPNNPNLSLVIFKNVLPPTDNRERACQFLFKRNDWCGIWANGVLDYHHYHSTSHEALGIVAGSARILFGGENGKVIDVAVGDVVILPAGVGHCCVDASGDFQVVGAYPCGQENWDLCTGGRRLRRSASACSKHCATQARSCSWFQWDSFPHLEAGFVIGKKGRLIQWLCPMNEYRSDILTIR